MKSSSGPYGGKYRPKHGKHGTSRPLTHSETKHQGRAIKTHYLAILSNLSNQDLPTHPSTDSSFFLLKNPLVQKAPAAACYQPLPNLEAATAPACPSGVINPLCAENLASCTDCPILYKPSPHPLLSTSHKIFLLK